MAGAPAGLPPGSVIGILGGGQLGRMIAAAAARLGYRCHVYCPEEDAPAAEVAAFATCADYRDEAALAGFAKVVDVVTLEFENVPAETVERLAETVPVRPDARALAVAQDRVEEKSFLNAVGVSTTRFAAVASAADLRRAMDDIGAPAILKTARLGYDGKGQREIRPGADPEAAWRQLGAGRAILEERVDFQCEVSVVIARAHDGATAAFDTVENEHENGILRTSRVPARIAPAVDEEARALAARIAEALDYVGVLAVELFVTRDSALLANEIAPRVHNSGHWTLDACAASQFEQAVRAACALPLADPARHSDAVMTNILGRRDRRLAGDRGRAGRLPPPLRQGRRAPRTQDGPRHPAEAAGVGDCLMFHVKHRGLMQTARRAGYRRHFSVMPPPTDRSRSSTCARRCRNPWDRRSRWARMPG